MSLARAIGLGALPLFCASLGCALFIGLDAGEGAGSSGGDPDAGGMCAKRQDCPEDEACSTWACEGGQCVTTPVSDGSPAQTDSVEGDCKASVCEGGSPVAVPDDTDVPMDGDTCAGRTCAGGEIAVTPVADGTACGPGDMNACYEDGVCASGACVLSPKLAGIYVGDDAMPGNCKGLICDGNGAAVAGAHDEDLPVDMDPDDCKRPICSNGAVGSSDVVSGSACSSMGGVKCCSGECCKTSHTCAETGDCCPNAQQCPNGTCCPTGKSCSLLNICS